MNPYDEIAHDLVTRGIIGPGAEALRAEASFAFIIDSLATAGAVSVGAMSLIREMAKRAEAGDIAAEAVLEVMYRFERLLRVAGRRP